MRTKNVIGVLQNLKHDKCGYEVKAINQAIYCVEQMHQLSKATKRYRSMENSEIEDIEYVNTVDNPLGYNPYQE